MQAPNSQPGRTATARVWDLPTRLFHWSLAACIVGSLVSVNLGGNAVAWHFRFGYAILALLLFRLAWGFVGPRYARFSSFPPNPMAALRYLRGAEAPAAGHSPLGALSVYALLLSLAFQAGTGLFANDAIMWDGPLRNLVSNASSDFITKLHKLNRIVLLSLILLHLCAIAFYALKRRRSLVKPMIVGDAELPAEIAAGAAAADGWRERLLALAVLAAAAAIVWAVVTLLP
ncbi:cytochrome b/b6 domain-containing protein [Burkholderiaceae bacterium FT117]|uniref:cytochrome b/b6 domain-containing protein n=1 Tax=Zeimonas sediminis TaxID=2944268 RepID=UPI002342EA54|nr:cytochrome b/b6 domain-containing protein [Zeimonas sediminis]MCM5570609.1 cytochrome b/b6 domain-containing protein [Zeimonas sediminis]